MIGQTISHYKILEKLGEGGMGVVYKARDTKLDRDVALKFLPESLTPTEEDKQRFFREAKAAAALTHPNICTIHNIDEHEGRQFIVMEYIEGETLRTKIGRGELTVETALKYATKIAGALGKAHQNDIIHRDIKPENIMFDEDGRIKVMDFGLAKLKQARDITKTGDTVGTLAYMSPEQIRGQEVDHRSDIFSLGILLYEMLTGAKPFQGEHQAAMTYSIVNEEHDPLSNYLPDAPEELTEFLDHCLAKEPEDRLGSAAEAKDFLEKMTDVSGGFSHQTSPAQAESEATEQDSGGSINNLTKPSLDFGYKSVGKFGLIAGAMVLLVVVLFAGWWFIGWNASDNNITSTVSSEPEITDRSIAVLPFTNQGGGEDVKSITLGLHDDLLTRLSNVGELQVISRTSVEKFRDADLSLPLIADSLGVQWVVEGGVQEAGGQIRVNAKLINPENGVQQWADSYQRELTAEDLFAIQEEIAGQIAGALQTQLSPSEQERITGAPTEDLDAYRLYVQGRTALNTRTEQGVVKAMNYFRRAVRQDSSYALAWSGLADAIGLSGFGPDSLETPESGHEKAARRALELNPELAEAQASMGFFYMHKRNAPAALHHLKQAVELKPSYVQARHWLALLYLNIGQLSKAYDHISLAVQLNPQHNTARNVLVEAHLARGEIKQAREHLNRHRGIDQPWLEAFVLYHEKNWDELGPFSRNQLAKDQWPEGLWRFSLGRIAAMRGDTSAAREQLAKIQEGEDLFSQAMIHAALGQRDAAFEDWLEQIEKGQWTYMLTTVTRYLIPDILDPLRKDPRYEKLIRRINDRWGLNPDGSIPEDSKFSNSQ